MATSSVPPQPVQQSPEIPQGEAWTGQGEGGSGTHPWQCEAGLRRRLISSEGAKTSRPSLEGLERPDQQAAIMTCLSQEGSGHLDLDTPRQGVSCGLQALPLPSCASCP